MNALYTIYMCMHMLQHVLAVVKRGGQGGPGEGGGARGAHHINVMLLPAHTDIGGYVCISFQGDTNSLLGPDRGQLVLQNTMAVSRLHKRFLAAQSWSSTANA